MELIQMHFAMSEGEVDMRLPSGYELPEPRWFRTGTPLLFDSSMRPLTYWNDFLRIYAYSVSEKTIRAYGYDLRRFAEYLVEVHKMVAEVDDATFQGYRQKRLLKGISQRTLQRELVVIRAFFHFLVDKGVISRVPWMQIGRWSAAAPRAVHSEMKIRALSNAHWLIFRNIGLAGQLPNGEMDSSIRLNNSVRDTTAAELALSTGMRLQEWRTLLIDELIPDCQNHGGAKIWLEKMAKNERPRRVYVPASTMKSIQLYFNTERASKIRDAQEALRSRYDELSIVQEFVHSNGRIVIQTGKSIWSGHISRVPESLRKELVREVDGTLQPLSAFLGRGGRPLTQRAWLDRFATASKRVVKVASAWELDAPAGVSAHDLRHTFAIVILKYLQELTITRSLRQGIEVSSTPKVNPWATLNPLRTLQSLLGHASIQTTTEYLRFIDDRDDIVQKAFESWDEFDIDYREHLRNSLLKDREN